MLNEVTLILLTFIRFSVNLFLVFNKRTIKFDVIKCYASRQNLTKEYHVNGNDTPTHSSVNFIY